MADHLTREELANIVDAVCRHFRTFGGKDVPAQFSAHVPVAEVVQFVADRLTATPAPTRYVGGCNCAFNAPTVPTFRDPRTHLDDCPAKGSGFLVGQLVPVLTNEDRGYVKRARRLCEGEELGDIWPVACHLLAIIDRLTVTSAPLNETGGARLFRLTSLPAPDASDTDALVEEAQDHAASDNGKRCTCCGDLWPCLTRRLADALAEANAVIAKVDLALRVPAAEYVPAIRDAFAIIDARRGAQEEGHE